MSSGATRDWSVQLAAAALGTLLGCTQDIELGSECPPDTRCGPLVSTPESSASPGGSAGGLAGAATDAGTSLVGEFELDAEGPSAADAASEPVDSDAAASADAGPSTTDASAGGSVVYPNIPNGSFEVTSGPTGTVAYQPTGSPPLGFTVIAPWTACMAGYEAVDRLASSDGGPDVLPTEGLTFLRAPVTPATSVGLDRQFPEPLKKGQTYGFRIDLRSTAATASVSLAVFGVALQCIAVPTPLARSEGVSRDAWVSTCITFTADSPYTGIVLSASADSDNSGESLLLDNLRDDPLCTGRL